MGRTWMARPITAIKNASIEILHVPIRSYEQLERKIRQGAEALQRNKRISPGIGDSWRKIYANHLQKGTLPAYYDSLRPKPSAIAAQLIRGELIDDRRLQRALNNPLPHRVAVITPYYKEPLAQLRQCHDSVLAQSEPCLHVLVADGHPRRRINHWQCRARAATSQPWRHRLDTALNRQLSRHRSGGGCRGLPRCRQLVRARPHRQSSGGNGPTSSRLHLLRTHPLPPRRDSDGTLPND